MTDTDLTRRQTLRAGGAALAGATVPAATATASSNGADGIIGDGFADVGFEPLPFARGLSASTWPAIGPPNDLEDLADRARNEFNANATAWVEYGNWLLDEHDVEALGGGEVGVEFKLTRYRWATAGGSTDTTIVVDYDDDAEEFTGLTWETGSADDPEYQITVADNAVENAADELQTFRREWIGEDDGDHELPSDAYLNELGARYAEFISFGEDTQSALEVLLGEVSLDVF